LKGLAKGVRLEKLVDRTGKHTGAIRDNRNTGGSAATGRVNENSITSGLKSTLATFGLASPVIVRSNLSIGLYMPNEITTTYTHEYSQAKTGGLLMSAGNKDLVKAGGEVAKVAKAAADDYMGTSTIAGITKAFKRVGLATGTAAANSAAALKAAVTAGQAGGAAAVGQAIIRKAFNPRIEFLYQGTSPREFSYTFKMIPHSEPEAMTIHTIIQKFKEHSHPKLDSTSDTNFIHFPNQFEIEYLSYGDENQFLNKISTCILSSMSVDYAPDGAQFYRKNAAGSPPFSITMQLNFTETEILTANRIQEGF
jgi:hypothetical protein